MANELDKIAKSFVDSFRTTQKKKTSAYDSQATVVRVEENTAWVHIPGGVDETPAQMTMSASPGDIVQVRVSDGRAWLTGNTTAPPTDDKRAIVAELAAQSAVNLTNATQASLDVLDAKVAVIDSAYIDTATVNTLLAGYATISTLEADYATITSLNAVSADVQGLNAQVASIEAAYIDTATVNTLLAGKANITLANVDTANINKGSIRDLFTEVGLITSATIVDGKVTGVLDAVTVNGANIIAGTVVADRLVIRGTNESIVYALNNYGQITSTQTNTLDGYVLTPRTVNADRIIAGSITGNEIAASTITANKMNVSNFSAVTGNVIDITAGKVRSGDYTYSSGDYSATGMCIDLTNKVIRTPKFAVTSAGKLYATDGDFSGSVTATSGKIGGWAISSYQIAKNTTIDTSVTTEQTEYQLYLRSQAGPSDTTVSGSNFAIAVQQRSYTNGTYGNWSYNFSLQYNGKLTAKNADISGKITADAGDIGGWGINNYQLVKNTEVNTSSTASQTQYQVYIRAKNTDGTAPVGNSSYAMAVLQRTYENSSYGPWSANYSLRYDGYLTALSGKIGPWYLNSTSIYKGGGYQSSTSGSAYFGNSGLSVMDKFYVDNTGDVYVHGGDLHIRNKSGSVASLSFENVNATDSSIIKYDATSQGLLLQATNAITLYCSGSGGTGITLSGNVPVEIYGGKGVTIDGQSILLSSTVTTTATVLNKVTNYTRGVAPSSSIYRGYCFVDSVGTRLGIFEVAEYVNGNAQLCMYLSTPTTGTGNAQSGIVLTKTPSGVLTCDIGGGTTIAGTLETSSNINIVSSAASSYAVGVQNGVGKVQLYMASNGNMGVYDATNSKYLIYKNSSGNLYMSYALDATVTGSNLVITSSGQVGKTSSSRRYKHDIKALTDYRKVLDIPVVSFVYNEDCLSKDDQRYGQILPGFIAEDVAEHYGIAADRRGDKIEDWNLRFIVPPMLAVLQDQERRIKALEDQLRKEAV